jgi:hypothetical protein
MNCSFLILTLLLNSSPPDLAQGIKLTSKSKTGETMP